MVIDADTEVDVPYDDLTPDVILQSMDELDLMPSGRMLALNSYENRVYQIELDSGDYVVVKYYRPHRWTDDAILEEHEFALELAGQEIPVIAPNSIQNNTLHNFNGYRYAVYKRHGGRAPELDNLEHLEMIGRFIGRIHQVGSEKAFQHRRHFTVENWGYKALETIMASGIVPDAIQHNLRQAIEPLLDVVKDMYANVSPESSRLHGDAHAGNVLWRDDSPHFVDLDDCCNGPIMQDLWMLLSGETEDMSVQMNRILDGYESFYEFDYKQLNLIEPLRALRLIHYCAWLCSRWHDPAFPRHFPWFNTPSYWEEQIVTFREQLFRCQLPVLRLR